MNKNEWWPKEGKLKKGFIILGIVIIASLLITLMDEKGLRFTKRIPFVIVLACLGVWFYQPVKNNQ